jgi:hypothetical protein
MPDGRTSACHWNVGICLEKWESYLPTYVLYVCSRPHGRQYYITADVLLLLCDTVRLWVPLQSRTHKPISLLQKARRKPALTTYTSYPLPYCDAASYTSTLPTEKTTQTPPSQAVNRYYYHLPTVQLTANNTERLPLSYLHPAEVDAAFGHSHLVAEFRSRASRWCVSGRGE